MWTTTCNGCSDGKPPDTNPPDTDPLEQLEGELHTVPVSYRRLRICDVALIKNYCSLPALQHFVSACAPHAHFYTASLSSLCSEYTHKVEKVITLTPESPVCMVTPTTANIHELKAVRLVVLWHKMTTFLLQQRRVTILFSPFVHPPTSCLDT